MITGERQILKLLTDEAALLDAGELDSWLSLYDEECRYWIPSEPSQTDPDQHVSIIYDDRTRLTARIARLQSGKEHAQTPFSVTCHQLTNLTVYEHPATNAFCVEAVQVVYEKRPNTELQVLPSRVKWLIRHHALGFRIARKRIDLVDVHRYFENLTFIL